MSRVAPSTTPNAYTPNNIQVTTATGFSQGDLVYYNNGDYKPLGSLPTPATVNFPAAISGSVLSSDNGGFGTPIFNSSSVATTNGSGSSKSQCAAVLTNGNIVQVFTSKDNIYAYFRIVNSSGTVIVSPTSIGTSQSVNYTQITVCALTGGGFAVSWQGTSGVPYFAVYTNTGSVTTAVTANSLPSGVLGGGTAMEMTALANGGFAVVVMNTSSAIYLKIYTSTGATTSNWTNIWSTLASNDPVRICSRSDSSIFVLSTDGGGNYQYALYNATGGSIVAPTSVAVYSDLSAFDAICLSDGTTIVFTYTQSGYLYARRLPTGNVLQTPVILQNISSTTSANVPDASFGSPYYNVRLLALSNGGFAFMFSGIIGNWFIGLSNATSTTLTPSSNTNGVIPYLIKGLVNRNARDNQPNYNRLTVFEISGNVYIYSTFAFSGSGIPSANMTQVVINESTISATPTNVLANYTPSINIAGTPSSNIVSSSTPTNLKYYANSTFTQQSTNSISIVQSATVLTQSAVSGMHSCTLTNGYAVIVYIVTATSNVYASVVSPTGSTNTFLVGTGGLTSIYTASVRVVPMASGKFAVIWSTTATTININFYSATYSLLTSIQNSNFGSLNVSAVGFDATGSTVTDQVAIFSNNTSTAYVWVYGNTGTLISQVNVASSANFYKPKIAADSTNGFMVCGASSNTTAENFFRINPTSSTSWTAVSLSTINFACDGNYRLSFTNNGIGVVGLPSGSSGQSMIVSSFDPYCLGSISSNYFPNGGTSLVAVMNNDTGVGAVGLTGFGTTAYAYCSVVNSSGTMYIWGGNGNLVGNGGAQSVYTSGAGGNQVTFSTSFAANPNIWITPSTAYNVIVSWRDQSGYPNFAIVNTFPDYVFTNITSGTTVSNAVPIYPGATATSPAIQGAILSGVANSTVSAGNTGSLTTNGSATLNSNYNASTPAQAFDYQSPNGSGVSGVKGTIVGRNVTLFGN